MKSNKLSVILPIYNGMPYLKDAILSLLDQTFQDFIIYAIDNGSTDGTREYIQQLSDEKITYINLQEKNLVNALNTGLEVASSPFIARMDADDIIHPKKFEKQMKYLEENEDIHVIGTLGQYISTDGKKHFNFDLPLSHDEIIETMIKKKNAIIHASIMFRSEIISLYGNYKNEYFPCEDYELFLRIGNKIKFANLPERLYFFRVRKGSIMTTHFKKSIEQYYLVSKLYAHKYSNHYTVIEHPKNFHLSIFEKLDVLSVSMYRKGLYYYLNVSSVIGVFNFIIASLLNPFRLIQALKIRMTIKKLKSD